MKSQKPTRRRPFAAAAGSAVHQPSFLQLNKVLDPEFVDLTAWTQRQIYPKVDLLQMGAVSVKADDDAARLRPIFLERRGQLRVVSVAEPQVNAADVLQRTVSLELQLHPDLVGAERGRS